jgi:hypothetical protein
MLTIHLENVGCTVYHTLQVMLSSRDWAAHLDARDLIIPGITLPVMLMKGSISKGKRYAPGKRFTERWAMLTVIRQQNIAHGAAHDFIQKPTGLDNITAKIGKLFSDCEADS